MENKIKKANTELCFLHSISQSPLTKIFENENFEPRNPRIKNFAPIIGEFKNFENLFESLQAAQHQNTISLVFGIPRPELLEKESIQRKKDNFIDNKSIWLILDIDKSKKPYDQYLDELPLKEFKNKTCIVNFTCSHEIKQQNRFRLFFKVDTPLTIENQKHIAQYFPGSDLSIYQKGRFLYTAEPVGKYAPKIDQRYLLIENDKNTVPVKKFIIANLENEVSYIESVLLNTEKNHRNNTYNTLIHKLAKKWAPQVRAGKTKLTENEIYGRLSRAALTSGLTETEVQATWESAWESGAEQAMEGNKADLLAETILAQQYKVLSDEHHNVLLQNPDTGVVSELLDRDLLCQDFINKQAYDIWGYTPNKQLTAQTVAALRQRKEDKKIKVGKTINWYEGELYIKIGRSYFMIGSEKWKQIDAEKLPIIFAANNENYEIKPIRNIDKITLLDYFKEITGFQNFTDDDWVKIILFVLHCFNPFRQYSVLILNGSAGSGKSTLSDILNYLIDGHYENEITCNDLSGNESNVEDWTRFLGVVAEKWHLLSFNNVSYISDKQSDVLSKIVLQQGTQYKKLYSQTPGVISEPHPIIMNGIGDFVKNSDLRSRSIFLELEPPTEPLVFSDLEQNIVESKNIFLGILFDILQCGLKEYYENSSEYKRLEEDRAGILHWGQLCYTSKLLGVEENDLIRVFKKWNYEQRVDFIENNFVLDLIIQWFEKRERKVWAGSATDLKKDIEKQFIMEVTNNPLWPKSPRGLAQILRKDLNVLRLVHQVKIDRQRTKKARSLIISSLCI